MREAESGLRGLLRNRRNPLQTSGEAVQVTDSVHLYRVNTLTSAECGVRNAEWLRTSARAQARPNIASALPIQSGRPLRRAVDASAAPNRVRRA